MRAACRGELQSYGSAIPVVISRRETGYASRVNPELADVKACVFDTFGTVVDWRGSVIAEATSWGKAKGFSINWVEFTDRWRLGYRPAMDKVRRREIPWTNLDDLDRMILWRICSKSTKSRG